MENKANAPVLVALEGEDPDGELRVRLQPPAAARSRPARRSQTAMQVRPPKQIWIGRPTERRFTVTTLTGEEAEERLAAEPTTAEELEGQPAAAPQKTRLVPPPQPADDVPGVYGPRVYKPQVYEPGMQHRPERHQLPQAPAHAARRSRARR